MTSIEQRKEELEIKFAYQETTLDVLNEAISRQQQQLDRLEILGKELLNHFRSMADGDFTAGMSEDEKPPHY